MSVKIMQGDVREQLAALPNQSVHCAVTSPPYWGLRDYGVAGQIGLEPTPAEYVETMVQVFREVRRVLQDDGTLWLNLGDSYCSGGRATWRSGASKNKGQHVLNDMPRPAQPKDLKPKDLIGIPWRVAFALQNDGWYLRQDIIWAKPNPMPESVRDRCTKSHEYIFLLSKSERYYFDAEAIQEPFTTDPSENYPARAQITGRGEQGAADARGNDRDKSGGFPPRSYRGSSFTKGKTAAVKPTVGQGERTEALGRNMRSVWTVATKPFKDAHFATFPPSLIEPCILAGSPRGGVVLDPFGGAGTTGLVAERHGRSAILIELNPEYAAMAHKRISGESPLFAEVS